MVQRKTRSLVKMSRMSDFELWKVNTVMATLYGKNREIRKLIMQSKQNFSRRDFKIYEKILEDLTQKKNWLHTPILTKKEDVLAATLFIQLRMGGIKITEEIIKELGLERDWQALNKLLELYGWFPKKP